MRTSAAQDRDVRLSSLRLHPAVKLVTDEQVTNIG